jgi:lysyl-tRNA synthetase class I
VTALEKPTGILTEKQTEILRAFNHEFLKMAGYDEAIIGGYDDLAKFGPRQMDNLIRQKIAGYVPEQVICPKCHTVLSKEVLSRQSA